MLRRTRRIVRHTRGILGTMRSMLEPRCDEEMMTIEEGHDEQIHYLFLAAPVSDRM